MGMPATYIKIPTQRSFKIEMSYLVNICTHVGSQISQSLSTRTVELINQKIFCSGVEGCPARRRNWTKSVMVSTMRRGKHTCVHICLSPCRIDSVASTPWYGIPHIFSTHQICLSDLAGRCRKLDRLLQSREIPCESLSVQQSRSKHHIVTTVQWPVPDLVKIEEIRVGSEGEAGHDLQRVRPCRVRYKAFDDCCKRVGCIGRRDEGQHEKSREPIDRGSNI